MLPANTVFTEPSFLRGNFSQIGKEASLFAFEILIPENEIRSLVREGVINTVGDLADYFKVSSIIQSVRCPFPVAAKLP